MKEAFRLRLFHSLIAAVFAAAVSFIYVHVLDAAKIFSYMGVRVVESAPEVRFAFFVLAIVPTWWLPIHLTRPSDIIELFLYYAVHVPTCVLLPLVSVSPAELQLSFALASMAGLATLRLRYYFPLLNLPPSRLRKTHFWCALAIFYLVALVVFARSGYLSSQNISLYAVYDQRIELKERRSEIGAAFFYLANWTGTAFAPFLMLAGLFKRRQLLMYFGIVIALASFVASSNKFNYMAIPVVVGSFVLLKKTRGRWIAYAMGLSFLGLACLCCGVDYLLTKGDVPVISWLVFHRTFSNNGFLSSVYLDFYSQEESAMYTDSFMRWFIDPVSDPVAQRVARSFTNIPNVHANAHLWADGYANLHFAGVGLSAISALLLLWLYDSITVKKSKLASATAVVVPATVLANSSVHTAILSNGLGLLYLLMYCWTDVDQNSDSSNEGVEKPCEFG